MHADNLVFGQVIGGWRLVVGDKTVRLTPATCRWACPLVREPPVTNHHFTSQPPVTNNCSTISTTSSLPSPTDE